jgi:hypothetical protein
VIKRSESATIMPVPDFVPRNVPGLRQLGQLLPHLVLLDQNPEALGQGRTLEACLQMGRGPDKS